jgi:hypothetical protein
LQKGNYYIGYVNADTPKQDDDEFTELISGVIWLVRNKQPYVSQSASVEDMSVQESGTSFVDLRASRLGIGHDQNGNLMIVQFDGDGNHHKGPNLYELAQVMIDLGAVNAINLDGGGSTTVVQDDILVNTISDGCGASEISPIERCARKVTTITCIHDTWIDVVPYNNDSSLQTNCTREYDKVCLITFYNKQVDNIDCNGHIRIGYHWGIDYYHVDYIFMCIVVSSTNTKGERGRAKAIDGTRF